MLHQPILAEFVSIHPESRVVEISKGPDQKPYKLIHIEANRLSVDP